MMPLLEVPNARVHYETFPADTKPENTLLILVHGGNGTGDVYRDLALSLQDRFNVCVYDRRGFTRSLLTGPQDYTGDARLDTDADDVKALKEHLSPEHGAVVMGSSSGAIVALHVLERHPEALKTVVAHETPAFMHLPDNEQWLEKHKALFRLYREKGHVVAMAEFAKIAHAKDDRTWPTRSDAAQNPYFMGNLMYWFERELNASVTYQFNMEALSKVEEKLVLVNGRDTHTEAPQYMCNMAMSEALGVGVTMFEGGHFGYVSDPAQFAKELMSILQHDVAAI
jgi:pimeloyl-ACP methyl ester carboxylesterase